MAIVPDYRVQLEVYNGPLDLLLFLIRRSELDIYDIPIAEVTRQYCEFVQCLRAIDPDAAAEFVVMAATLMEIKSRMLLPTPPPEEGAAPEDLADPRLELVRQLLEYKRFKDASIQLSEAAAVQALRWPRGPIRALATAPAEYELDEVQVWDLVSAFNRLMAAIGRDRITHDVVFDDTPIAEHATDIQGRLSREGAQAFEALFIGRGKVAMIGLFLALLELIRQRRVRVEQRDPLGPIVVVLLSTDAITVGAEWEYAERGLEASDEESAGSARSAGRDEESPALLDETLEGEEERDEVLTRLDEIKTDVDIHLTEEDASSGPRATPE